MNKKETKEIFTPFKKGLDTEPYAADLTQIPSQTPGSTQNTPSEPPAGTSQPSTQGESGAGNDSGDSE